MNGLKERRKKVKYIYESPDGGKTINKREIVEKNKVVVEQSLAKKGRHIGRINKKRYTKSSI